MASPSINTFAAMTQRIIAQDGFENHLPTALYPKRRHVAVLEGPPETVNVEAVALHWARQAAQSDEEFLVAFKIDEANFKVIHCNGPNCEQAVFPAQPQ